MLTFLSIFGKISIGINQFDCKEMTVLVFFPRKFYYFPELSTLLPFTVPTLVFTPLNVVTWFVFEIYPRAMNAWAGCLIWHTQHFHSMTKSLKIELSKHWECITRHSHEIIVDSLMIELCNWAHILLFSIIDSGVHFQIIWLLICC